MTESGILEKFRSRFLEQLRKDIDHAWENRSLVSSIDSRSTVEDSQYATQNAAFIQEQMHSLQNVPPEQINVTFIKAPDLPSQVFVLHSHDYRDLLILAFQKIGYGIGDKDMLMRTVNEVLHHEYQHHVPALGEEGLQIQYGVQFMEDAKTRIQAIRPMIRLRGQTNMKAYQNIHFGLSEPSLSDKITKDALNGK